MPVSSKGTYYQWDGPDTAPVLVLIHGLGLTGQSTWAGLIDRLALRYRVLSYDLPGHGQSRRPEVRPDLSALASQLIDLMQELGIQRAVLAGFSLGGMINRRVAMDAPNRVAGLIILNSPHDRGETLQQQVEQQALDAKNDGPGAVVEAALERWFTSGFRQDYPEQVAQIRGVILDNDPQSYAWHRWVLAHGVRELIRPTPPIRHKTLVVTCDGDVGSTPGMARAIASEIADAELQIIPGLKHLGLLETPDIFTDRINEFMGCA